MSDATTSGMPYEVGEVVVIDGERFVAGPVERSTRAGHYAQTLRPTPADRRES